METGQRRTRRRWLSTCASVVGTAALAGCFGSDDETGVNDDDTDGESAGSDWPMYGVDLQNTAFQPSVSGPDGRDVEAREVYDLGGASSYPVITVGSVLYVTSRDGVVLALDRETEELLWEEQGHGPLMAHDGAIYGPRESHRIYGYDRTDGDRWESDVIELDDGPNLNNDPIPTENGVFVISDHNVWRIDPDGGEYTSVRSYPRDSRDLFGTTDVPAYEDGVLYHAMGTELYALDVETGEHEWTVEGESVLHISNPAVADGLVLVPGGDARLYAFDADSGEEVWSVETNTGVETSPAVADGIAYLGDNQRVLAVDIESGELEWDTEELIPEAEVVAGNGVVYTAHSLGITTFDAKSGDLHWELSFDDGFTAPPTISDGSVYVPSLNDSLYAIESKQ